MIETFLCTSTNMAGLVFGLCIFLITALAINSECTPQSGITLNNTIIIINTV